MFQSLGEYDKPKEYYEKALTIRMEIGGRAGEANCCGSLGSLLHSLGEHVMAENYLEKAVSISHDIGDLGQELDCLCLLASVKVSQVKFQEALAFGILFFSVTRSEDLRGHLRHNDQFKISYSDVHDFPYQGLAALFVSMGNRNNALHVLELARARALADLMASQYSLDWQISADPQSWIGIDKIMNKESCCCCLYISWFGLWILKASAVIYFREITVNEKIFSSGLVDGLDDFFEKNFRSLVVLPWEDCEDCTLNDIEPNLYSSEEEKLAALRQARGDDDLGLRFMLFYNMIIAPVVDLLEGPEIIVIPEPCLYRVPFAALIDDSGNYLSETFRIRIAPSLAILKSSHDSPAHYHCQSGALIVGDPEVGRVRYNGGRKTFTPFCKKGSRRDDWTVAGRSGFARRASNQTGGAAKASFSRSDTFCCTW